jgi:3-oxoacyl-[acyl-carrier protein] reductase
MQLELSGKVAVVSAATKGIGRECAMALAREGARVALFSRDGERLQAVADDMERETGYRPFTQQADLTDAQSIRDFFEAVKSSLGPLEVLVANSVGPSPGPFEKYGDEDWLSAFEGAFLSTARMIRAAIPQMREAGGGSVVAIQSTSVKQPIVGLTLSNGVRPGVAGLMKSLAMEYGQYGMRFNVVCPGRVMTDRFLAVEASHGQPLEERIARMAAEVPMRRLGKPNEVADAVLFLSSARASYITGSVLAVDGGNVRSLY